MLIMSKDTDDINATRCMLFSMFDIKDLGVADMILGVGIIKTPWGLSLSQSHYIEKVLHKVKYLNVNIVKTLIYLSCTFQKNEGQRDSHFEYGRVLGSFIYIMNCTQPDIACRKIIKFTCNPNQTHWMEMKRVLGYMKDTQHYALQ